MASTVNLAEIQEYSDSHEVLQEKVSQLAHTILTAQHFIAFTGAGLSTAADIPDYRGPNGAWTRKAQGRTPPKGTSFALAKPTFSHQLLSQWVDSGRLTHIVSQNVDGLHRRSGIKAENISELHGNSFLEKCWKCSASYLRDAPVRQRGNGRNGGKCPECSKRVPHFCHCTKSSCGACGAVLKDSIIHFRENLPEDDLDSAFEHAEAADLCLVVGSSCRVTPAADVPQRVGERGKALVIINKQATPLDHLACLVIHADIDAVFSMLHDKLSELDAAAELERSPATESSPADGTRVTLAIGDADSALHPIAVPPGHNVAQEATEEEWGLAMGNTHVQVQGTGEQQPAHEWTLFLTAVGDCAPELSAVVQRCDFHLHPTFRPSCVSVEAPPFAVSRRGWGTFTVYADVYFHQSTGLPPLRLEHPLDFSQDEAVSPPRSVQFEGVAGATT